MYKIFNNGKPVSKHNVLLAYENHVRQESFIAEYSTINLGP